MNYTLSTDQASCTEPVAEPEPEPESEPSNETTTETGTESNTETSSTGTSTNSSEGSTSSTETSTDNSTEIENKGQLEVMATASTVALAGAAASAFVSASLASSSTQSMWSLMNQYQLVIMFPLLRSYLSEEFKYFIKGFEFALFNFYFLGTVEDPLTLSLSETIGYDQPDELYQDNGLESGCYVINQLSLIRVFMTIAVLHVMFLLIHRV